jgi:(R,R)-butanediol dehydrogenase/meso-butanediol dehydrogenase/diacetyl reductase
VTASHGRIVIVAVFEETVAFNPSLLMLGEVEIVGSTAYAPGVFDRVIALMETGAYPTTGWVEHIPFDRVIPDGLEALRRGERTKVLVDLP